MPISMSPSAHYVTQTSVYSSMYCGPLTNAKIRKYSKLGYYGSSGLLAKSKEQTKQKAKHPRRHSAVDSLLSLI